MIAFADGGFDGRAGDFLDQQRDRRPASPGLLKLPLSVDRDLLVPRSGEVDPSSPASGLAKRRKSREPLAFADAHDERAAHAVADDADAVGRGCPRHARGRRLRAGKRDHEDPPRRPRQVLAYLEEYAERFGLSEDYQRQILANAKPSIFGPATNTRRSN